MNRVQNVLQKYIDLQLASLGKLTSAKTTLDEEDRKRLEFDLKQLQQNNSILIWVSVVMLITLFIVSMLIIIMHLDKPIIYQGAGAALGISSAGCIRWMLKIWQEKTNTELLLRLAISLGGDALMAAIKVLARDNKL